MKNRLQYAYSITVFIGVLMSSYLILEKENRNRLPAEAYSPASQLTEAAVVDPVVNQLFEFEEALSSQYEQEEVPPREPTRVFPETRRPKRSR